MAGPVTARGAGPAGEGPGADLILHADRVVFPVGPARPGWVRSRDGFVVDHGTGEAPPGARELGDAVLAPGFVDVHVHGGGGAAFTEGAGPARAVLAAHRAHGTTTMIASLVTDRIEVLEQQVLALVGLAEADEIAGIHLEGPWLSERRCGAHDPDLLIDPVPEDVDRLIDAGGGYIRMVTLAPEREGALEAIRGLRARGVVAAVGHTDATDDQVRSAIRAGAQVGTHLFNAMPPLHHREPGPIPRLLTDPGVMIELIADGVHVHPSVLRMAMDAGRDRFVLITDAMAAAGRPDGSYRLGPLDVDVVDGVARIRGTEAIAGSTLTLDKAVRFAVERIGLPLEAAVRAASQAPADLLGRTDIGRIVRSARADLVVLDAALTVQEVFHHGQKVR
ncbi:N-acetylglucosamine-6-phosphate deacetylase [Kocuria coralli]|uniref:N-acetylglucosamine-6-phosphate deacetylase n=1 Tax=Kocuria coralli TaxID=1461025 RepID=A0A5J5KZ38_9MICC|nr:N-acetylglucosamine-6-phosphate deacetylase [Kocuria coralli]